ncbi:MAG: NAD(P)(+) transhydrogenase (Re/Si-specific) subunit alpha, partial [Thermogutta sp.]|nr:NAD(P)(+) transhydrogenase (Re/Si-specific) subunit alpha [Thermogutta sp.]
MIIGVLRERFPGEKRVAVVPANVPGLIKAGHSVRIESGAGERAGFPDSEYSSKGASVASLAEVL